MAALLILLTGCLLASVYWQTTVPTTPNTHPPGSCEWSGQWYADGADIERSEYDGCVSGLLCDNGDIIAWDGAGCFGITTPVDPTSPTISPDGSCFYEGRWYSDEEEISRTVVDGCKSGLTCLGGSVAIWDNAGCFGMTTEGTTGSTDDIIESTDDIIDSTDDVTETTEDRNTEVTVTEETDTKDYPEDDKGKDGEKTDCEWQGEMFMEGQETRSQVDGCDIKLICSNGKMISGNKDCNSLADDPQQIKDGPGGAATRITVNTQVIVLLSVILYIFNMLQVEHVRIM